MHHTFWKKANFKKGLTICDPRISWYPFGNKNHEIRGPPVFATHSFTTSLSRSSKCATVTPRNTTWISATSPWRKMQRIPQMIPGELTNLGRHVGVPPLPVQGRQTKRPGSLSSSPVGTKPCQKMPTMTRGRNNSVSAPVHNKNNIINSDYSGVQF